VIVLPLPVDALTSGSGVTYEATYLLPNIYGQLGLACPRISQWTGPGAGTTTLMIFDVLAPNWLGTVDGAEGTHRRRASEMVRDIARKQTPEAPQSYGVVGLSSLRLGNLPELQRLVVSQRLLMGLVH